MATKKQELAEQGKKQADLVINNAFIDGLTAQLNEKCKYGLSFPKDYNLSNALMGAYLTLKETTDKNNVSLLQSCSQASIANSLMDMATMGLSVQKKQGYFIGYKGQCQFQRSYFGNITIARRYGMKDVNAEVIYEGDKFVYSIKDGIKVFESHEQDFMNIDNEKIIGAYAVAIMQNGDKRLEVMNINQIKQAWKQGYGYKEGEGTHAKFTDQMAKKTVTNRLLKVINNTYGDGAMIESIDRTEDVDKSEQIVEDVAYDIESNADTVDFEEAAQEVETIPEEEVEMVEEVQEEKDVEIPDFMKSE